MLDIDTIGVGFKSVKGAAMARQLLINAIEKYKNGRMIVDSISSSNSYDLNKHPAKKWKSYNEALR